MKAINRKRLIKLLQSMSYENIFEDEMNELMRKYGDDWYIEDGKYVLTNINKLS